MQNVSEVRFISEATAESYLDYFRVPLTHFVTGYWRTRPCLQEYENTFLVGHFIQIFSSLLLGFSSEKQVRTTLFLPTVKCGAL